MIKCLGVCSACGRCQNSAMMSTANERKTKLVSFPENFIPDAGVNGLGVAFDIGTTTVVGMLWNYEKQEQAAVCARTNPQNQYGMDVISRITFSMEAEGNLDILRNKIIRCLNEMLDELCTNAGRNKNQVTEAVICGNTTMSHIFAGYSPVSLSKAPFEPAYKGTLSLSPQEAGIEMNAEGHVIVIPNIAGHVGGDITAGILAARLDIKAGTTLFIDIGTNGEIVLKHGGRMLTCSTAAGPAFEGASIKHGMRAAEGAIEKVMIQDGEVFIKTIGNHDPQGICGSGLIDAVAQMLQNGLINKKGRLASVDDVAKGKIDERLGKYLTEIDGERCFILAEQESGGKIVITQNDVREVQLAKGAILAGIKLMLQELGKELEDIDEVIIAGAFGSYIDKKNAVKLGILPDIDIEKIVSAGNTAGAGTLMALASIREEHLVKRIPDFIEHIELAEKAEFQNTYVKSMLFM